jgi:hypothetical protein
MHILHMADLSESVTRSFTAGMPAYLMSIIKAPGYQDDQSDHKATEQIKDNHTIGNIQEGFKF